MNFIISAMSVISVLICIFTTWAAGYHRGQNNGKEAERFLQFSAMFVIFAMILGALLHLKIFG